MGYDHDRFRIALKIVSRKVKDAQNYECPAEFIGTYQPKTVDLVLFYLIVFRFLKKKFATVSGLTCTGCMFNDNQM
jgi:hypothetical protein